MSQITWPSLYEKSSQLKTVGMTWRWATALFAEAGFETPDTEARALLSGLLRCTPTSLLMRNDDIVDDELLDEYREFVTRRLKREPVAYIIRGKNFMGFDFDVEPHVLIPRPETELLVDDLLMEIRDSQLASPKILDVGTGSGCIAVSLARLVPEAEVVACDISPEALKVAQRNAQKQGASVQFILSDLMTEVPQKWKGGFDMIASNPPYIVSSVLSQLQPEISHEPRLALDGGEDGLLVLRRLIQESLSFLKPNGLLVMEIGHDQGNLVRDLLENSGFEQITILKDYSGFDRIAKGRKQRG